MITPSIYDVQNRLMNNVKNELWSYNIMPGYIDILDPFIEAISKAIALEIQSIYQEVNVLDKKDNNK